MCCLKWSVKVSEIICKFLNIMEISKFYVEVSVFFSFPNHMEVLNLLKFLNLWYWKAMEKGAEV